MKNIIPNQWGQINSFQRIDTGYQNLLQLLEQIQYLVEMYLYLDLHSKLNYHSL
ncbi:MAG: hypothetical protein CM15mV19_1270 [uncultured marine virus]|nr:MAG: hypothetical protein CM15mV19_1270 [uncultured marine virus]